MGATDERRLAFSDEQDVLHESISSFVWFRPRDTRADVATTSFSPDPLGILNTPRGDGTPSVEETLTWKLEESSVSLIPEAVFGRGDKAEDEALVEIMAPLRFKLDGVFTPRARMPYVYQLAISPLVHSFHAGLNGSVFLYGPRNVGKTSLFLGDPGRPTDGLLFMVMSQILPSLEKASKHKYFRLGFSAITATAEDGLKDILRPNGPSPLPENLNEMILLDCSNMANLMKSLAKLEDCLKDPRAKGKNPESCSLILRVLLEIRYKKPVTQKDKSKLMGYGASLVFVDCAGYTDQDRITSLTPVEDIFRQIGEGKNISSVRADDSRLVEILQPAFGGNSRALVLSVVHGDVEDGFVGSSSCAAAKSALARARENVKKLHPQLAASGTDFGATWDDFGDGSFSSPTKGILSKSQTFRITDSGPADDGAANDDLQNTCTFPALPPAESDEDADPILMHRSLGFYNGCNYLPARVREDLRAIFLATAAKGCCNHVVLNEVWNLKKVKETEKPTVTESSTSLADRLPPTAWPRPRPSTVKDAVQRKRAARDNYERRKAKIRAEREREEREAAFELEENTKPAKSRKKTGSPYGKFISRGREKLKRMRKDSPPRNISPISPHREQFGGLRAKTSPNMRSQTASPPRRLPSPTILPSVGPSRSQTHSPVDFVSQSDSEVFDIRRKRDYTSSPLLPQPDVAWSMSDVAAEVCDDSRRNFILSFVKPNVNDLHAERLRDEQTLMRAARGLYEKRMNYLLAHKRATSKKKMAFFGASNSKSSMHISSKDFALSHASATFLSTDGSDDSDDEGPHFSAIASVDPSLPTISDARAPGSASIPSSRGSASGKTRLPSPSLKDDNMSGGSMHGDIGVVRAATSSSSGAIGGVAEDAPGETLENLQSVSLQMPRWANKAGGGVEGEGRRSAGAKHGHSKPRPGGQLPPIPSSSTATSPLSTPQRKHRKKGKNKENRGKGGSRGSPGEFEPGEIPTERGRREKQGSLSQQGGVILPATASMARMDIFSSKTTAATSHLFDLRRGPNAPASYSPAIPEPQAPSPSDLALSSMHDETVESGPTRGGPSRHDAAESRSRPGSLPGTARSKKSGRRRESTRSIALSTARSNRSEATERSTRSRRSARSVRSMKSEKERFTMSVTSLNPSPLMVDMPLGSSAADDSNSDSVTDSSDSYTDSDSFVSTESQTMSVTDEESDDSDIYEGFNPFSEEYQKAVSFGIIKSNGVDVDKSTDMQAPDEMTASIIRSLLPEGQKMTYEMFVEMNRAATAIQAMYRGAVIRKLMSQLNKAVRILQRKTRQLRRRKARRILSIVAIVVWFVAALRYRRQTVLTWVDSVLRLQRSVRMWIMRRRYLKLKAAALKAQSVFRGFRNRKWYTHMRMNVVRAQALTRMYIARTHFRRYMKMLRFCQKILKGRVYRKRFISALKATKLLQKVARQRIALRRYKAKHARVLNGYILKEDTNIQFKEISIFVSSTFTDTAEERNRLIEEVYPKVKRVARRHGYAFSAVEMRWGIREESTQEHKTAQICLDEIRRCRRDSRGLSYILILGNKYGFRPFPAHIEKAEFEKLQAILSDDLKRMDAYNTLQQWFKLDTNAIPSNYVLQRIDAVLPAYMSNNKDERNAARKEWWEQFEVMQFALRDASRILWAKIPAEARKFEMSVTESEVYEGMVHDTKAEERTYCIKRDLMNIDINDPTASNYIDVILDENKKPIVDEEAQKRLHHLKVVTAPSVLSHKRRKAYSIPWKPGGLTRTSHAEYLQRFIDDFDILLVDNVMTVVERDRVETGNAIFEEILQHNVFCYRRNESFTGRSDVLLTVMKYLTSYDNRPFVLYGPSGAGKTSVMARLTQMMREKLTMKDRQRRAVYRGFVVCRFCGTSTESCSSRQLILNICQHINELYTGHYGNLPAHYKVIVRIFQTQVLSLASAQKPLYLFLDSLDNLNDENDGRSLVWLPSILPPHVKVVVSTLPDVGGCMKALQERLPPSNFCEVPPLEEDSANDALGMWLSSAKRRLTQKQLRMVLDAFADCPLPLFLKVTFETCRAWHSYDADDQLVLQRTIPSLIDKLYSELERVHGRVLIVVCLGLMTVSRYGLSDNEMEDLLSCDDEVLNDVFEWWEPPVRRIPSLLWMRVKSDLGVYLVTRGVDGGTPVVTWYHRQFFEAAARNFLRSGTIGTRHDQLADYFCSRWAGVEIPYIDKRGVPKKADRMVADQPLVLNWNLQKVRYSPSVVCEDPILNLRRMSMEVYHRIQGSNWSLAAERLIDIDYIDTKCRGARVMELMEEMNQLFQNSSALSSTKEELQSNLVDFRLFLQSQAHILNRRPHLTLQQAMNQPGKSGVVGRSLRYYAQTPQRIEHRGLLLRHMNKSDLRDACLTALESHVKGITGLVYRDNKLISCSVDKLVKVWVMESIGSNASSEELTDATEKMERSAAASSGDTGGVDLLVVRGSLKHHRNSVTGISISPDGQRFATSSADGQIIVWSLEALAPLVVIPPEVALPGRDSPEDREINKVMYSPDGSILLSARNDSTIMAHESASGRRVAVMGSEQDREKRKPKEEGPHDKRVMDIRFSPNGEELASCSYDRTVKLWRYKIPDLLRRRENRQWSLRYKPTYTLRGHSSKVVALSYSPNGRLLASASHDTTICVWDMGPQKSQTGDFIPESEKKVKGSLLRVLRGHTMNINCVEFSPNGTRLVSGGKDKLIFIWDVRGIYPGGFQGGRRRSLADIGTSEPPNEVLARIKGHSRAVTAITVSPDNLKVFSGDASRQIRVWDMAVAELNRRLEKGEDTEASLEIEGLVLMKSDIETTGGDAKYVKVPKFPAITLHSTKELDTKAPDAPEEEKKQRNEADVPDSADSEHEGTVWSVEFSPDGSMLASGGRDGAIRIWNSYDGRHLMTLLGHKRNVCSLHFSKKGDFMVSGSWDTTLCVWDMRQAVIVGTLKGHTKNVWAGQFNPSDTLIASGSEDRTIRIWDAIGMREVRVLVGHTGWIRSLAWNEEGTRIVSCSSDRQVMLWDTESWQLLHRIQELRHIATAVVFRPGTKEIFVATADMKVMVFSSHTCDYIGTLAGHKSGVNSLAATSDGAFIASGAADKCLRLWSAASGQCVGEFVCDHSINSVALCYIHGRLHVATGDTGGEVSLLRALPLDGVTEDDYSTISVTPINSNLFNLLAKRRLISSKSVNTQTIPMYYPPVDYTLQSVRGPFEQRDKTDWSDALFKRKRAAVVKPVRE
eukprot:Rmarinus@m.862